MSEQDTLAAGVVETVRIQFRAAYEMLCEAIERCPATLWAQDTPCGSYGRIAYHTLYFVDLFLTPSSGQFTRPLLGYEGAEDLDEEYGPLPQQEVRQYVERVWDKSERFLERLDARTLLTDGGRTMINLEKMLYMMRHVQHHVAQLDALLCQAGRQPISWIKRMA